MNLKLSFVLLFQFSVFAQKSDIGKWLIYFGDKKMNEKWNWHHKILYRSFDALGDSDQVLLHTEIGYTPHRK